MSPYNAPISKTDAANGRCRSGSPAKSARTGRTRPRSPASAAAALKRQARAEIDCRRGEGGERQAADPPVGGEGVEIDIVRVFAVETIADCSGPKPRAGRAAAAASAIGRRTARFPYVIVLAERRPDVVNEPERRESQRIASRIATPISPTIDTPTMRWRSAGERVVRKVRPTISIVEDTHTPH